MQTTLTLIPSYSSSATCREAGAVAALAEEMSNECFQAGTCVICEKSLEYVMTCMHVEKETIVLKLQDLCSIAEF